MPVESIPAFNRVPNVSFFETESTLMQKVGRVAWEVLTTSICCFFFPLAFLEMTVGGDCFFTFINLIDSRTAAKAYFYVYTTFFSHENRSHWRVDHENNHEEVSPVREDSRTLLDRALQARDLYAIENSLNSVAPKVNLEKLVDFVQSNVPKDEKERILSLILDGRARIEDSNNFRVNNYDLVELVEAVLREGCLVILPQIISLAKEGFLSTSINRLGYCLGEREEDVLPHLEYFFMLLLDNGMRCEEESFNFCVSVLLAIRFWAVAQRMIREHPSYELESHTICHYLEQLLQSGKSEEEIKNHIEHEILPKIISLAEEGFLKSSIYRLVKKEDVLPHLEYFFTLLLDNGMRCKDESPFNTCVSALLDVRFWTVAQGMIREHPSYKLESFLTPLYVTQLLQSGKSEEEILNSILQVSNSIDIKYFNITGVFSETVERGYFNIAKYLEGLGVKTNHIWRNNHSFISCLNPDRDPKPSTEEKLQVIYHLQKINPQIFMYDTESFDIVVSAKYRDLHLFLNELNKINFSLLVWTDDEIDRIVHLSFSEVMKGLRDRVSLLFWFKITDNFSQLLKELDDLVTYIKKHHIFLSQAIETGEGFPFKDDLESLLKQSFDMQRRRGYINPPSFISIGDNAEFLDKIKSSYKPAYLRRAFRDLNKRVDNVTETTFEELSFEERDITREKLKSLVQKIHLLLNKEVSNSKEKEDVTSEIFQSLETDEVKNFFEKEEYTNRFNRWGFYEILSGFYFAVKEAKRLEPNPDDSQGSD